MTSVGLIYNLYLFFFVNSAKKEDSKHSNILLYNFTSYNLQHSQGGIISILGEYSTFFRSVRIRQKKKKKIVVNS